MSASIHSLAPELVEMVAENLDLASLKSLRLASHQLSNFALGPHFKSFMTHQITDLSDRSLRKLEGIASFADMRASVTTLTIQAKGFSLATLQEWIKSKDTKLSRGYCAQCSRDRSESPDDACEHVVAELKRLRDLRKELANLNAQSATKRLAVILGNLNFKNLHTLKLEAVVETGHEDITVSARNKPDWKPAAKTFDIVMDALEDSNLNLTNLEIGATRVPEDDRVDILTRSMIEYHQKRGAMWLPNGTDPDEEVSLGDKIQSLTVGTTGWTKSSCVTPGPGNFVHWHDALLELVSSMGNLTTLDLRLFAKGPSKMRFMDELDLDLPKLETFRLRGWPAHHGSLRDFFEENNNGLKHITLDGVHLTAGEWNHVFLGLSRHMPHLETLTLAHLSHPTAKFPMTAQNLDPFHGSKGIIATRDAWAQMKLSADDGVAQGAGGIANLATPLVIANRFTKKDFESDLSMVRDPRGLHPKYNETAELTDPVKTEERMRLLEERWEEKVEEWAEEERKAAEEAEEAKRLEEKVAERKAAKKAAEEAANQVAIKVAIEREHENEEKNENEEENEDEDEE